MQKDLIKIVNSSVHLSSRSKIEERRMLKTLVNTLFPPDQNASDVKGLDTRNKNVQLSSRLLGKTRPLLLPRVTPNLTLSQIIVMIRNLECLHYHSESY